MTSLEVFHAPWAPSARRQSGSLWPTAVGRQSPPRVAQLWPGEHSMFDFW